MSTIRFERDRTVAVASGKVEIGQGIVTALAQIAAEELDVSLARIRMLPASTEYSPDEGFTSGSLSIQAGGTALRTACVQARARLLAHAAELLGAPAATLAVDDGTIRAPNGDSTSYWECAAEADAEAPPGASPKPAGAYRVVGTNVPRLDLPGKIAGRPSYLHDLVLPGMLHGRVLRPPRPFSALRSIDASGLRDAVFVRDGSFVGVLAEREELAIAAVETLRASATWDEQPLPADFFAWLRANVTERQLAKDEAGGAREAATTLRARYTKPFIAHASIGPSCALARFGGARLEVWTHNQGVFPLRRELALVLRMREEDIVVRFAEGAGCYGHNGADDAALDAALLARAAQGRPVRLQWSRADEFAWEPFGAAMMIELEAGLDATGSVAWWTHELWSNGHTHRPGRAAKPVLAAAAHLDPPFELAPAVNPALPQGGADRNAIPLYDFPGVRVINNYVRETPIRSSSLRSLGGYANVFAIESFVDELAGAAGGDPFEFRLRHLADPRARAVLEALRPEWDARRRADGRGHGLGFAKYKNLGAYCAVLAEVEADAELRVRRLSIAVDVGLAVNPDGVANQIEGGAVQAVSWTLMEDAGSGALGWQDYPILKFSEVPDVAVIVIGSAAPSVGAGEAAQGPTAAAIANALHDALGVRVRDLPLTAERIARAIG